MQGSRTTDTDCFLEARRPSRPRRARILPLAVAAALLQACGTGSAREGAVVRDSAGIAIVENASPADSAAYDWWRLEGPQVDIGGEDGVPGQDLFRVGAAVRLADGRIVVANGGSSDLRFFDEGGNLLFTAGRSGEGPGEFRSISWLANPVPDSLFVFDRSLSRVSVFGRDGSFVRDFLFGGPASMATAVGILPDRSFIGRLVIVIRGGASEPMPQGRQQPDILLVRLDAGGTLVDTVGAFAGPERYINVRQSGGEVTSVEVTTPLFGRTPYHEVAGDDLYAGEQDAPEIRVFGPDGRLRRIVRTGRPPERVTNELRNAKADRMLETMPEDRRREFREGLLAIPSSEFVPSYGELHAGRTGELWVADYDDGLQPRGRWTVYGPDGRGLARIVLPARFTPYDIGKDWIIGREYDELDIEHVRLYRVARD